jgi:hypothetical protein
MSTGFVNVHTSARAPARSACLPRHFCPPLSQKEIDEAGTVFADTVPYDKVWVTNLETFGVVIGASSEYEDMVADPRRSRIFIHEMTHVWQIVRSPTLTVQCEGVVDRARDAVEGIDAVYGVDPNNLQPWDSYNWEQQGDLIEFAYRDRKAVPASHWSSGGSSVTSWRTS